MSDKEGKLGIEGHCPICIEGSKQEKPKCDHREPLVSGYGFGRVSGWYGLGITFRCHDCAETLWFDDDYECNTPQEIEHNAKKREENEKYRSWKSE